MPVDFDRGSPAKFDSRTLNRKTLSRWTGRITQASNGTTQQKSKEIHGKSYGKPKIPAPRRLPGKSVQRRTALYRPLVFCKLLRDS